MTNLCACVRACVCVCVCVHWYVCVRACAQLLVSECACVRMQLRFKTLTRGLLFQLDEPDVRLVDAHAKGNWTGGWEDKLQIKRHTFHSCVTQNTSYQWHIRF